MGVTKTAAGSTSRSREPTPSPPVSASNITDLQKTRGIKDRWIQRYPLLGSKFLQAQGQTAVILTIAALVNRWPKSYHRNENHNPTAFWLMWCVMLAATLLTLKHEPASSQRGIPLLSRAQTEEWKGWMQWMFIMYHYYRMRSIYMEIRVFVSCYVWMTGFGNFLYFDKTQDFTLRRAVSMWIRINYFPLLLCLFLGVNLELYYVVPLHTTGFFMTMTTCYVAKRVRDSSQAQQFLQQRFGRGSNRTMDPKQLSNIVAILISLLVHMLIFETPARMILSSMSKEIEFRFHTDKYSAWFGILCGFLWGRFKVYMQWCYGHDDASAAAAKDSGNKNEDGDPESQPLNPSSDAPVSSAGSAKKIQAMWIQRGVGVSLFAIWKIVWGRMDDKVKYNELHPFVFWMPMAAWLLLRNSSRYLTEVHSEFLDFLGRITLETYVLQFHVFMCQNVQHIPVVIPGSGPHGYEIVKFLNMLVCGSGFILLAWYARRATVATQETLTDWVDNAWKAYSTGNRIITGSSKGGTDGSTTDQQKPTLLSVIDEPHEEDASTDETPRIDKKDANA